MIELGAADWPVAETDALQYVRKSDHCIDGPARRVRRRPEHFEAPNWTHDGAVVYF